MLLLQIFFASAFSPYVQSRPTEFHKPPDRSPILGIKFPNGFNLEAIDTLQKQYRFERVARLEKSTEYTVDLFFKTDQPLLPATQRLLQNRLKSIGAGFFVPTTFLKLENGFIYRNHFNLQKNTPLLRLLRQEMAYPGLDAATPLEVSAQLQAVYQPSHQYLLLAGPWASVVAQKIAPLLLSPSQNANGPGPTFQSLKLFNRFKNDFVFPAPMTQKSTPELQFVLLPTEEEKKHSLLLPSNPFSTGLLPYIPTPPSAFQTILEFLDHFRWTAISPFFFPVHPTPPSPSPPSFVLDSAAFPSAFHPLSPQPAESSFKTILAYLDHPSLNQNPLAPLFFPTLPKVEPPKPPHTLQIVMTLPPLTDVQEVAVYQHLLHRMEHKMKILCSETVPEKTNFSPIQTVGADGLTSLTSLTPLTSLTTAPLPLGESEQTTETASLPFLQVAMQYKIQYPSDTAALQLDLSDAFKDWHTETAAQLNADPKWQRLLQEGAEQFNALNADNDKACTAVEFALANAQRVHWVWMLEQEKSKLTPETFQKAWEEQIPEDILINWEL